jgi:hypothetical protein
MSSPQFDFSNSANWDLFWYQSFQAVHGTPTRFAPIPETTYPVLLDSHILAVYADSASASDNWYFAGFLSQKFQLGLTVGGMPDTNGYARRKVWLRRITLIAFPQFTSEYALAFAPPKWFEDINLTVWRYTGPEPYPTETLIENLQQDVLRVESKIDAINQ